MGGKCDGSYGLGLPLSWFHINTMFNEIISITLVAVAAIFFILMMRKGQVTAQQRPVTHAPERKVEEEPGEEIEQAEISRRSRRDSVIRRRAANLLEEGHYAEIDEDNMAMIDAVHIIKFLNKIEKDQEATLSAAEIAARLTAVFDVEEKQLRRFVKAYRKSVR